jgi:hypothetical protein
MEEHPRREVGPPEKNKMKLEPPGREVSSQRKDKGEIEFPKEEVGPAKVTRRL